VPSFHAGTTQERQNAISGKKLLGWQKKLHRQGRASDKKKPLLVGDKDQGLIFRQYLYQRPEKPVGDGPDKIVGTSKACDNDSQGYHQAGAQFSKMLD
jgi:hypothetical protein